MGCGEYNPLSLSTKDAESRRVVLLVYDVAAEPQALPCKLRSLAPCKANVGPEVAERNRPDRQAPVSVQGLPGRRGALPVPGRRGPRP